MVENLTIVFKNNNNAKNNNNYKKKLEKKINSDKKYFNCHKLKYYALDYIFLNKYLIKRS